MGFCWRRIFLILFMFLVFFASVFVFRSTSTQKFLFNRSFSSPKVDVTEEVLLERLAISFPELIKQLSKLSPKQQKQFIEYMRRTTVSAASANGRSDEQAQKLGEAVAMVLSKAVSNPSVTGAYF